MNIPSKRCRRVADLILREIAELIRHEIRDPRLQNVAITGVEISPDLGHARVYYTLLEKTHQPEVDQALARASGHLRHELAARTELMRVPSLHFIYDKSVIQAEELSHLINEKNPRDKFED